MTLRSAFTALAALVLTAVPALAQTLGVGDPAPRLRVGGWLRGEPITSFERDRIYVVEFWATWCVPCRRTIPQLSALQQRFASKGVRIIGVSIWEDRQADVAPFVEEHAESMKYDVAIDSVVAGAKPEQGAMALSWMRAAGENSIPTAFIVDGGGKIAWIGDTSSIEKPLEQIVAGTWDMDTAKIAQQRRVALRSLNRKLSQQLKAHQATDALATIDEMLELAPESEIETAAWRFKLLLELERADDAYAYAKKAVDGVLKEQALQLNLVAWFIVDPKALKHPPRDLDFALRVARRADELTEHRNAAILDTLALVHFERGEIDTALELQEKAVELAADSEWLLSELKPRLEQYRAAKKKPLAAQGRSEGYAFR